MPNQPDSLVQLTLQQWELRYHIRSYPHDSGARFVLDDGPRMAGRSELWHLADWFVSSVAAGTIWLTERK